MVVTSRPVSSLPFPDRLAGHFAPGTWNVLLTLQTDPFLERAHVGQPHDHTHRMGVLIATKSPDKPHERRIQPR